MTFELPPNDPPEPNAERPGRLSPNGQMIAIGVYGGLLVAGFFFGIVAGYEPAKPAPGAMAARDRDTPKPDLPTPEPSKPAPKVPPDPQPPPTSVAVPKDEPRAEPPKPAPDKPAPEGKKVEAKKPEPEPKKEVPSTEEVAVKPVSFQKDVLPIFKSYCVKCHGATAKPKGDVDLTTLAKIIDPKNPPVLTPGKPEKSAIYTTVVDLAMPPQGDRPGKGETEVIRNWILGGAKPRRRFPGGVRRSER